MRLFFLLIPFLLFSCTHPKEQKQLQNLISFRQAILVITPDEDATQGQLFRYEMTDGKGMAAVGEPHPVMVGRSGLAWGRGTHSEQKGQQKKEGDGKSPAGIFRLTKIFGYEPPLDLTFKMPFVRADEVLECVDDSWSKFYNQLEDSLHVEKDWTSSEFMRRQDHQYKWGVVVEHNREAVPQGGSCIFLHIWKEQGAPTAGCTAMAESDLLKIIHWLDEKKNPVLIQLTESQYENWKKEGVVPSLK